MAGPFIEAANQGISDESMEIDGEELSHQDLLNVLNHHSQTKPSSAPSALMGAGLPWHYEKTDTAIAGVYDMSEHILEHEGEEGEFLQLIRKHIRGEIENTVSL